MNDDIKSDDVDKFLTKDRVIIIRCVNSEAQFRDWVENNAARPNLGVHGG